VDILAWKPEVWASIASTVTSVLVAAVALRFSYRQNVGWAPIAFVEHSTIKGVRGKRRFAMIVDLEFWNRRKYPVILKHISGRVEGVKFVIDFMREPSDFIYAISSLWLDVDGSISPSERGTYTIKAHIDEPNLELLRTTFHLRFKFFDPYLNRTFSIQVAHKFMFPHLGWSDQEPGSSSRQMEKQVLDWARRDSEEPDSQS
jgi:hypothetical protein